MDKITHYSTCVLCGEPIVRFVRGYDPYYQWMHNESAGAGSSYDCNSGETYRWHCRQKDGQTVHTGERKATPPGLPAPTVADAIRSIRYLILPLLDATRTQGGAAELARTWWALWDAEKAEQEFLDKSNPSD